MLLLLQYKLRRMAGASEDFHANTSTQTHTHTHIILTQGQTYDFKRAWVVTNDFTSGQKYDATSTRLDWKNIEKQSIGSILSEGS